MSHRLVHATVAARLLLLAGMALAFFSPPVFAEKAVSENIKKAVIKIEATSVSPDYFSPWRTLNPMPGSGSGVVIDGERILTNAHVVADARFVQVSSYGQATKFRAEVEFISHAQDLAILKVADNAFFKGIKPLRIGELPRTQQQVTVLGYPMGGNSLSTTQGVLSRIEHIRYAHSGNQLLAGQIDAAINPGNSGGPVIVDNRIIGIVMQSISGGRAENLGYLIPPVVIRQFLADIQDGKVDGVPDLAVVTQSMENPGLRAMKAMPDDLTGVLIAKVFDELAEWLSPGDVLLAVDGHAIAGDQTVEFRPNERTAYMYYIDNKQLGDEVTLRIWRAGEALDIAVPVLARAQDYMLVGLMEYDQLPRYVIYGGVIFTPLTVNLIARWGKDWRNTAPVNFLNYANATINEERTELVVALRVLANDINQGYTNYGNQIVAQINGKSFSNFAEFVSLLKAEEAPYMVFEDESGYQLVIDSAEEQEHRRQLMLDYGIPEGQEEYLGPAQAPAAAQQP